VSTEAARETRPRLTAPVRLCKAISRTGKTEKKVANAGKKNFELEKSMRDLESIVEQLEGGDLTLDKSLKEFEKGVRLSRECQQALSDAEQKVQILIDSELQETDPKSLKDGT
jgi:exodeoxyribonuclease VII small subunit